MFGRRRRSSQGCEKSVDRSVESAKTKQQIVCEINRLAAARTALPHPQEVVFEKKKKVRQTHQLKCLRMCAKVSKYLLLFEAENCTNCGARLAYDGLIT